MFCKKCGNEISPSEKFCSKCGTPVGGAAPSQPAAAKQISFSLPAQFRNPLGIMYAAGALLHLLLLIFWSVNTTGVEDYAKFNLTTLFSSFMSESADVMTKSFAVVFMIIFSVVSILLCVAPVLMNTVNKARKMIFPMITCVWSLIWFIYALNAEAFDGISATFFGWIFIIFTVITLLLHAVILLVSNKIVSLGK